MNDLLAVSSAQMPEVAIAYVCGEALKVCVVCVHGFVPVCLMSVIACNLQPNPITTIV